MDHFRIEGVAPVNMADVRTAVTESESRVVARLEDFGARFTSLLASNTSSSVISEHTMEAVQSGGGTFHWRGTLFSLGRKALLLCSPGLPVRN